jgi:hypothetical protein
MMEIEESLFISVSRPTVFRYAARPENMPAWNPAILESRVIGPLQAGATVIQRIRLLGRSFEAIFEITSYDPPRRIACQSRTGPVDIRAGMDLRSVRGGTLLHWVVAGNSHGFVHAAEAVMIRAGHLQMRLCLENLRGLVMTRHPREARARVAAIPRDAGHRDPAPPGAGSAIWIPDAMEGAASGPRLEPATRTRGTNRSPRGQGR